MNIICILCNARKGPLLENKMYSILFYGLFEVMKRVLSQKKSNLYKYTSQQILLTSFLIFKEIYHEYVN